MTNSPTRPAPGAIIVTGVSSGIGHAIASHHIARGRQVVGLARTATGPAGARLEALAAEAGAPAPLLIPADVRDPGSLTAAAELAEAEGLAIRTVVAAAGVNYRQESLEISAESVDAMLQTNVQGVFATFRAFAPQVLAQDHARFIAIGSVAGRFGMRLRVMYSATKAALEGMARGLAIEWAGQATVNVVAPGIVDTPLTRRYLDLNPGLEERVREVTLAGRLGSTDDVVHAVGFFDDPASDFVTGQTLVIDGGFSVGNLWW
jgi:NAD(P)-dependent dehydrogenase (short-subunit alcohol dehydrogenase family)